MAAISERTWSSIRHQAQTVRLKRATYTYNRVPRCRWSTKDEDKAREDYEAGVPIIEISAALQRSYSAIMQRASEKGWKRPVNKVGEGSDLLPSVKQRPMVSKGVSSGLLFGEQTILRHGPFLPFSPSLHHADLTNPDNCSGLIGDLGMATTLPHGLSRPKANWVLTMPSNSAINSDID